MRRASSLDSPMSSGTKQRPLQREPAALLHPPPLLLVAEGGEPGQKLDWAAATSSAWASLA